MGERLWRTCGKLFQSLLTNILVICPIECLQSSTAVCKNYYALYKKSCVDGYRFNIRKPLFVLFPACRSVLGKTFISFVMVIDWDYGSDEVNMKTRRMCSFWAKQPKGKASFYRRFSTKQWDDTKVHFKRIWESFQYVVRILSYFTTKSIYKEKALSISAVN
jgi:hypothetical protein